MIAIVTNPGFVLIVPSASKWRIDWTERQTLVATPDVRFLQLAPRYVIFLILLSLQTGYTESNHTDGTKNFVCETAPKFLFWATSSV